MAPRARVLVVEDDDTIRTSIAGALADAGHAVEAVADGSDLEARLASFRPSAVVLDWMLPGRDGPRLAQVVRATSAAGIVMVTARDEVPDRLAGFEAGVDDYVTKPFAMAELIARVTAVLRRSGAIGSVVQVADLTIDEDAGLVMRAGHRVELTATEFRLLAYLAANRDRVLSGTQLLTQVWGYDDYAENLVQVHVSALRRKLEAHGDRLVHTVRGLGYRLSAPHP
ncbi:response regulator transcription factor [Solicola sp. PLA-1-18]|uniref:response regulator transcription factor n=1 Tax=Solicola sp. PLA-1-18 TaxID=3380532 RepID=UPI003B7F252B